MSVADTVRSYYDSLRSGEPLHPYFVQSPTTVKIGVFSTRVGFEAVKNGLQEQTATTTDWSVSSTALQTVERQDTGRFWDAVTLRWTDSETGRRHSFDTRWTGQLARETATTDWKFTLMHVSAPSPNG